MRVTRLIMSVLVLIIMNSCAPSVITTLSTGDNIWFRVEDGNGQMDDGEIFHCYMIDGNTVCDRATVRDVTELKKPTTYKQLNKELKLSTEEWDDDGSQN